MQWSKIKKEIEIRFADEVKDKIQIYLTTYKNSAGYRGRGWITFKGLEIANFSNLDTRAKHGTFSNKQCGQYPENMSHNPISNSERSVANIVEKGEFSKYDFSGSCWEFLNMNIIEAQNSVNPIIRTLSVLDKRTGKKTLAEMDKNEAHPMVRKMIEARIKE